jgi:beta-barrel assembly-enhancing protease
MGTSSLVSSGSFLPLAWAVVLCSCAGTTTQQAPLPPGAVKAEQEKQRELVILENVKQQARLDEATYPILVNGTSLCLEDRGLRPGLRFATVHDFPSSTRAAAVRALHLDDTLTVLSVVSTGAAARAGFQAGDRILALDTKVIEPGRKAAKHFTEALSAQAVDPSSGFSVLLQRGSERRRVAMRLDEVCDYGTVVLDDPELNAFADGRLIYVTSAMMRFVDDDELRVVVSHEFAHNAMGHTKARQKNSLLGAMTFSQDFEREADYVGIYALALADLPVSSALTFWRRIAVAEPETIGLAHSHPTTAERFVRLEQGIHEINQKIALKHPLHPDPAGMPKPVQQAESVVASADNPTRIGSPPTGTRASVSPPVVVFTRDGFGASRGYKEYQPPEEPQSLTTDWSHLPGQPTAAPEGEPPSDKDWADLESLREQGDWLGQPHGRVYYRATCQAARELPEPIYFESEEEAQLMGYQPSQVPGC